MDQQFAPLSANSSPANRPARLKIFPHHSTHVVSSPLDSDLLTLSFSEKPADASKTTSVSGLTGFASAVRMKRRRVASTV